MPDLFPFAGVIALGTLVLVRALRGCRLPKREEEKE